MCDSIPLHYKQGDVVWVKLGYCWWPGEVYEFDKLPEDVRDEFAGKKQPLVSVNFFQEESYEFINNINRIYSYNCSRKEEFIRKGMDLYRAKNVRMDKFPADIKMAEKMTGGDEEILSDPKFSPVKKNSTPQRRNTPKQKASSQNKSTPTQSIVTHPRFVGANDHNVRVLVQTPAEEDQKKQENSFKCTTCGFSSPRVDVIVLHNKTHAWESATPKKKNAKKTGANKKTASPSKATPMRVSAAKARTIDDDLALLEKGYSLTDSELSDASLEDEKKKKKKKRKKGGGGGRGAVGNKSATTASSAAATEPKKNKKVAAIRGHILAEWDDGDDDEEEEINNDSTTANNSTTEDLPEKPVVAAKEDKKIVEQAPTKTKSIDSNETSTKNTPKIKEKTPQEPIEELDIEAILEATIVPKIPELPNNHKEKKQEVATRLTNPKKRFVKSFEDFEQSMKEKAKEEANTDSKSESNDNDLNNANNDEESVEKVPTTEKSTDDSAKSDEKEKKDKEPAVDSENNEQEEILEIPRKITRRSYNKMNKTEEKPTKEVIEKEEKEDKVVIEKETPVTDKSEKSTKDDAVENASKPEVRSYRRKPKEESKETLKKDTKETVVVVETDKTTTKVEVEKVLKPEKKDTKTPKKSDLAKQTKKEKILTEIDVFGSIRAEEDEIYNKKPEDSPRRETRSSRSKSRAESQDSKTKPEERQSKEKPVEPVAQRGRRASKKIDASSGSSTANDILTDFDAEDDSAEEEFLPEPKKTKKEPPPKTENNRSPFISSMKTKLKNMLSELTAEVEQQIENPRKKNDNRSQQTIDKNVSKLAPEELPKRGSLRSAAKPSSMELSSTESVSKSTNLKKDDKPKSPVKNAAEVKIITSASKIDLNAPEMILDKKLINSIILPAIEEVTQNARKTEEIERAMEKISNPSSTNVEKPIVSSPMEVKSKSPVKELPKSPIANKIEVPKSPVKVTTPSTKITTPSTKITTPSTKITSATKSTPIILNKDAPKPSEVSKTIVKSPRRVSLNTLNTQELTIEKVTDKIEINVNNEAKKTEKLPKTEEKVTVEKIANENDLKESPLDILASSASSMNNKQPSDLEKNKLDLEKNKLEVEKNKLDAEKNKQDLEKNITVLTDSVLAQAQVEIATIAESGTQITSIPTDITPVAQTPVKEVLLKDATSLTPISSAEATKKAEKIIEKIEPEVTIQPVVKPPIILNTKMKHEQQESTSKLLDILTDNKRTVRPPRPPVPVQLPKLANPKFEMASAADNNKTILTTPLKQGAKVCAPVGIPTSRTKPTILSDTLIKASGNAPIKNLVSVQKIKRTHDDIEDIDTFIIKKHPKKTTVVEEQPKKPVMKMRPKILEQTIITTGGQVMQPSPKQYVKKTSAAMTTVTKNVVTTKNVSQTKSVEEKMYDLLNSPKSSKEGADDAFDIDNMPIVLSDQILTADAIESMPMIIQESPKTVVKKQQQQQLHLVNKPQIVTTKDAASTSMMSRATPITKKTVQKFVKGQRVYQSATPNMLKQTSTIITQPNKPGKYIIVPTQSATPTGSKYTVGKRQFVKKSPAMTNVRVQQQNIVSPQPTGNKIMILTNNQGQQSRVLLTPEQQRLMGYTTTTTTKKIIKSSPMMHNKDAAKHVVQQMQMGQHTGLTTIKKTKIDQSKQQQQQQRVIGQKVIGSFQQIHHKATPGQTRTIIIKNPQGQTVKLQSSDEAALEKQVAEQIEAINRAANAKNAAQQQQQIVTKQQQFVKRAPPKKQVQQVNQAGLSEGTKMALQNKAMTTVQSRPGGTVPPLAPISPLKKAETMTQPIKQKVQKTAAQPTANTNQVQANQSVAKPSVVKQQPKPTVPVPATPPTVKETVTQTASSSSTSIVEAKKETPERPPKQLVIQDAMGNETTIVEGQILALPSETVDGQPQSYMLVTLDETGNLTPLNNEALMSLDLNLNLGGDLSNMVVQIDQNNGETSTLSADSIETSATVTTTTAPVAKEVVKEAPVAVQSQPVVQPAPPTAQVAQVAQVEQVAQQVPVPEAINEPEPETIQAVSCSINKGDTQQQLFITGDPIATQRFLESLSEGNPDLTSILANAEGNILIHAEGSQILINTDSDSPILMTMNDTNTVVPSDPIFSPSPSSSSTAINTATNAKNQDILAAALADTDVFQQEQQQIVPKAVVPVSQLSPGGGVGVGYPLTNVINNVLETSAMNSPIMTTQEMPPRTKKVETDVLTTPIAKNVDLPITITDPNIAQSVSNQQQQNAASVAASVAATVPLLPGDLVGVAANLDIPLTIQDVAPGTSTSSADMNSPNSFSYSLPSLDDSEKFNSPISMPLLTEDPEEIASNANATSANKDPITDDSQQTMVSGEDSSDNKSQESGTEEYLLASGEMCTMSNQISSLSEPPPDMFEFTIDSTAYDGAQGASSSKPDEKAVVSVAVSNSLPETTIAMASETISTVGVGDNIADGGGDGAHADEVSVTLSKSPKRVLDEEEPSSEEVSKRSKLD